MRTLLRQLARGLFGLQFRTTVLLTLVVLAATGLTGATYLRISSRLALNQTKKHARDIARALAAGAAGAVERGDREALLAIAAGTVPGSELCYLLFTDVTGEILASQQQGTGNITHLMLEDSRRVSVEPIDRPMLSFHGETGPRIDVVYPVLTPRACDYLDHGASPPTVGYVRLGLSLEASKLRLAALVRSAVGLAIGITLLMVPVGYELVRNVVGPLNKIGDAARTLAKGRLDTRVKTKRRDEIGQLTMTFNMMADELASSHNKLVELNAELEDRVTKRTMALEEANSRLREMAARDALTGLYNRRHFNDLLGQLFAESTRYHSDLTLMMLDLDNFKRVNDTLGHQTGDKLLRMTADVLLQCIRESDVAVRYGGDEFIVLWPQTSPEEARASAERILTRFRSELIKEIPEASIASLSIGVASRRSDEPSEPMHLVQLADEALYLAKAGGKNRITVLQPAGFGSQGDGI